MCFETALRAIEVVIRIHPGIVGRIGTAILASDENPSSRRMPCGVEHFDSEVTYRLQIMALFYYKLSLRPAKYGLQIERGVSAAIRDECDLFTIGRPARIDIVEIPVGKWERVAALRRHHPKLVPCLSDV